MECDALGESISALYDGEEVSSEAAQHIAGCANCRKAMREYAQIGVELRLLEANQLKTPAVPQVARRTRSFASVLTQKMRVPRFVAVICALAIIVLAAGWARTRAQSPVEYFQYKVFSDSGAVGGVAHACESGCEQVFRILGPERLPVGMMMSIQDIRGNTVHFTLRTKRFDKVPDNARLNDELRDAPAFQYVYKAGTTLDIPMSGAAAFKMEGIITPTEDGVPWWFNAGFRPSENGIAIREGFLIRDGKVIAELPGSVSADGGSNDSNPGMYAYIPKYGLFAVGLKSLPGAVEGTADYGQIRFTENGVKYVLLSASQVTGGNQPRPIWVLHLPNYLLSQGNLKANDNSPEVGSSGDIMSRLEKMHALP